MFENIEQMTHEQIIARCKEIYKQYSDDELKIVMGKDYQMFVELIWELEVMEERESK